MTDETRTYVVRFKDGTQFKFTAEKIVASNAGASLGLSLLNGDHRVASFSLADVSGWWEASTKVGG